MKRQSILMFLVTAIMAPSVFAQQKTIGDYLISAFDWTGGFFNEITSQGYESARFLMFVRLILVVLVITLFYTLLHRYIFNESKDKNKNMVLSISLGLLTTIAIPNAVLSSIAQLYSGALMLVLFGAIILGGFYAIFWGIKGENKGTYVLKAMMSLGVVFLTSMTISIFEKAPGAIKAFDWLLVIIMLIAIGGTVVFAFKIFESHVNSATGGIILGGSRTPAGSTTSTPAQGAGHAPSSPTKTPKVFVDTTDAENLRQAITGLLSQVKSTDLKVFRYAFDNMKNGIEQLNVALSIFVKKRPDLSNLYTGIAKQLGVIEKECESLNSGINQKLKDNPTWGFAELQNKPVKGSTIPVATRVSQLENSIKILMNGDVEAFIQYAKQR